MPERQYIHSLDNEEYQQPHVVSLFALVGLSITFIMGLISLYNQNIVLATTLFCASFIYFIGFYSYKKFKKEKLSSAITLYSLYVLMFYLIFTGGVDNTGPLWIYIVAPVSVFIHGLKRGLVDIAIFVIIIGLIMFISTDYVLQARYTTEFKLRLIYSFLTVSFLSALYEYARELSYKHTLALSKKYQQLANFDPLTQLLNRRGALTMLEHQQARGVRNNETFAVILCDIDFFKKINDQYGHHAGDTVLIDLARLFTNTIREQDSLSRWGGEEFLFILPQTNSESAYLLASKIQDKLQDHHLTYQGETIKVTVSMGVEQYNKDRSIDEIINSADKYLYQAKESGRNRICPPM